MDVILVHGARLREDGTPAPVFKNRLEEVVRHIEQNGADLVIVSGGKTLPGLHSEASVGKKYLEERISVPILTEERSRTTAENILFSKHLLEVVPDRLTVVMGNRQMPRVKQLYGVLWPEVKNISFAGVTTKASLIADTYELLYYLLALINPREKYLNFFKSLLRGGGVEDRK